MLIVCRIWLVLLHYPPSLLHKHTETVDSNVCTPLHHAAESGNIAIVIALVEEGGADINKASGGKGDTPLITSARQGHSQQARYLLSHGADVTAVNEDGTCVCMYVTSLHMHATCVSLPRSVLSPLLLGDTALSVAATTSMAHLLNEAWTEATEKKEKGPPFMDPESQVRSSLEQANLEDLEKAVGKCDSEVDCVVPTFLDTTPSQENDSVFSDEVNGHSQHPKAFITEVGLRTLW